MTPLRDRAEKLANELATVFAFPDAVKCITAALQAAVEAENQRCIDVINDISREVFFEEGPDYVVDAIRSERQP